MMSSVFQVNDAVAQQEVRSQQRQDGAPRGPGQTVRLVHAQAAGPQRLQGHAAALAAAAGRHQDDAEGAARHAEPPPHLAEPC